MGVCKIVGFALALFLCLPGYLRGVDSQLVTHVFSRKDKAPRLGSAVITMALHWGDRDSIPCAGTGMWCLPPYNTPIMSLWGAWNKSTPHASSNLLNWNRPPPGETSWPCYDADKNWQGVTCLRYQVNATQWNTWVVGLELRDASIGGTLPPEINQLNKLVTLSLTGNPNLRGILPREVADLPLNVLDLHDNGFTGAIPAGLSRLNLLELDLSGNQFSSDFPTQFMKTTTLQVFKISRNQLGGNISLNAFQNMIQLRTLDLSGNKFTGPPPKLSHLSNLHSLNLSHNNFIQLPGLSDIFKSWLPRNLRVLDRSGLNIGGHVPDWKSSAGLLSLERLYLDNNTISGILDIRSIERLKNSSSLTSSIQVLSLMHNNITDVQFDPLFLKEGQIKIYLQGNPYCTTEELDDGRRCFCGQYCTVTGNCLQKN